MFKKIFIRSFEVGLLFRRGEFVGLLGEGRHWFFDPLGRVSIDVVSQRAPWLTHEKLDVIVKSGALDGRGRDGVPTYGPAVVVDLKDYQRGLVWVDGRFSHVLPPGQFAYWTKFRDVRVEVIDARRVRFEHADLPVILKSALVGQALDVLSVEAGQQGVLFQDGEIAAVLSPGRYAFWKNIATIKLVPVDIRETMLDVSGQEIMTADKVTLRLNGVVTYRVTDVRQALGVADDFRQALYREAQLALRAVIGTRELDPFLADKESVVRELEQLVRPRAAQLGLEVVSFGIRDVILPGEMKDLMNKVTEAKKAAEANLIVRREETAAIRSQSNTAKLLQDNPTLMRLRELEVLEKIASTGKLNIVLGEKGLAERVINMI